MSFSNEINEINDTLLDRQIIQSIKRDSIL